MQVFDYIVNAVKRTGPSMEMVDDEDMATREDFSSWEWLVLNICEVCLASRAGTVGIAVLQELGLLLAFSAIIKQTLCTADYIAWCQSAASHACCGRIALGDSSSIVRL